MYPLNTTNCNVFYPCSDIYN